MKSSVTYYTWENGDLEKSSDLPKTTPSMSGGQRITIGRVCLQHLHSHPLHYADAKKAQLVCLVRRKVWGEHPLVYQVLPTGVSDGNFNPVI